MQPLVGHIFVFIHLFIFLGGANRSRTWRSALLLGRIQRLWQSMSAQPVQFLFILASFSVPKCASLMNDSKFFHQRLFGGNVLQHNALEFEYGTWSQVQESAARGRGHAASVCTNAHTGTHILGVLVLQPPPSYWRPCWRI